MSLAVSQMDSVTQQNAALVEESAAAAASLEQQAEQLRLAVAAFRITRDTSNSEHRKPPKDAPQATSAGVRHKTRIGKRFSHMLSCEPGFA